jgi:S1-C subfamily serine protease
MHLPRLRSALLPLLAALALAAAACTPEGEQQTAADDAPTAEQAEQAEQVEPGTLGVADLVEQVAPSVVAIIVTGADVPGGVLPPPDEGLPPPDDGLPEEGLPEGEEGLPEGFGDALPPEPSDELPDEIPEDGWPEDLPPPDAQPDPGEGQGSGVIIDPDGTIVTNAHVIAFGGDITVAFADGSRADAEVVASDERTDVAVLRVDVEGDLPAIELDEDLPRVGDLAVAIGAPLGFTNSVTSGVVSGLGRSIPGAAEMGMPALVDLIQTDAALSPGSSGGALIGEDGRVIGINVAFVPPQMQAVAIGFAIPAATVVHAVEALLADGEVAHPFLGVQPSSVTPRIAEQFGLGVEVGVLVLNVVEGSPAEEAGLVPGDVIVTIDGEPVEGAGDLLGALRRFGPGDEMPLTVVRDGEETDVAVTLGERDDDA